MKPAWVAPLAAASATSAGIRQAAQLDPAMDQRARRLADVGRGHQRRADQEGVDDAARAARRRCASAMPDSAMTSTSGGHERRQPLGDGEVGRQRLQVAIVDADDRRAERQRARAVRLRHGPRRSRPCRAARASAMHRARAAASSSTDSITSTASAPAARASATWRGSTMKSLARIGPSNSARAGRRSSSEPPKSGAVGQHADRIGDRRIGAPPPASTLTALRWPDGEARFTSMMKRAPGRASAARRLRRVGSGVEARDRASRSATSRRLRATISAEDASAMARLDIGARAPRPPRRTARRRAPARAFAQVAALPAVISSAAGVERDDVLLRLGCPRPPAARAGAPHSLRRRRRSTTLSGARSSPASSGVMIDLRRSRRRDRRIAARLAVQRDLVEARAVDDQRLARRPSRRASARSRRSIFGSATPSSCTGGRAGLMHGPSRFITVRTCSWRRTSAACFMPGMVGRREQEAEAGLVEQRPRAGRRRRRSARRAPRARRPSRSAS